MNPVYRVLTGSKVDLVIKVNAVPPVPRAKKVNQVSMGAMVAGVVEAIGEIIVICQV